MDEALDAGVGIHDKIINESVNDLFSNAANESKADWQNYLNSLLFME